MWLLRLAWNLISKRKHWIQWTSVWFSWSWRAEHRNSWCLCVKRVNSWCLYVKGVVGWKRRIEYWHCLLDEFNCLVSNVTSRLTRFNDDSFSLLDGYRIFATDDVSVWFIYKGCHQISNGVRVLETDVIDEMKIFGRYKYYYEPQAVCQQRGMQMQTRAESCFQSAVGCFPTLAMLHGCCIINASLRKNHRWDLENYMQLILLLILYAVCFLFHGRLANSSDH